MPPLAANSLFKQHQFWRFLILVLAGAVMTILSWQKWADLVVDFGLQVYVPWQLSEGQTLYADIVYFNGPFSVYLHALVFKIFGPGIMVLSLFNLFLIAVLTRIIYCLFKKFSDSGTAFLSALVFIVVFAFGQYSKGGNFNFVNPYVFELTHGILLSFLAIYQLQKYMESRNPVRIVFTGVILGIVFLTKPEVSLAAIPAVTLGFLLAVCLENISRGVLLKKVFLLFISMAGPPLAFFLYFLFHMTITEAAKGVLGQWPYVIGASVFRNMDYYKGIRGTDAIGHNASTMALYGFIFMAAAASAFFINHRLRKFGGNAPLLNILLATIIISLSIIYYPRLPWADLLKPLPLLLIVFGVYLFVFIKNSLRNRTLLTKKIPLAVLTVFSFILLFKMILNVHVYHYGFALAMPGTLALTAAVFYEIPFWAKKVSVTAQYYRSIALAIILVFIYGHVFLSYRVYQLQGFPVAKGRDVIMDFRLEFSPRGKIFNQTLDFINKEMDSDQAFVTLPNTNMLNYLARRRSSLKTLGFTVATWQFLGENYVLGLLKENPPLYIAFVDRSISGFGVKGFGQGYGRKIYLWVLQNYKTIGLFGNTPFAEKGFGIQILKRSSS